MYVINWAGLFRCMVCGVLLLCCVTGRHETGAVLALAWIAIEVAALADTVRRTP